LMAPHLLECSKLSNSLYAGDFLGLLCHSEVKYMIFGQPERPTTRIRRLWDVPEAYLMAPHLLECSKLSNSLYAGDCLDCYAILR